MRKIFFLGLIFSIILSTACPLFAKTENVALPSELTGDQLYEQGLNLSSQEKHNEAIAPLEEATKRKANFADAHYQLGICYLKTKQFDKAKQALIMTKVLSQDKKTKDEATTLLAKIPEEIEKEKKAKEDELRKKEDEEYQAVEAKEKQRQEKERELAELQRQKSGQNKQGGMITGAEFQKRQQIMNDFVSGGPMIQRQTADILSGGHPPGTVNANNPDEDTPLHRAALKGKKDEAELLVANNADVNAKNKEGMAPLHTAAFMNSKDVAELLLANGADVNAKDKGGDTPLHLAAMGDSKDITELLLANKADVNAKNRDGHTPLHWAVVKNHNDVAEILRQHGGVK